MPAGALLRFGSVHRMLRLSRGWQALHYAPVRHRAGWTCWNEATRITASELQVRTLGLQKQVILQASVSSILDRAAYFHDCI